MEKNCREQVEDYKSHLDIRVLPARPLAPAGVVYQDVQVAKVIQHLGKADQNYQKLRGCQGDGNGRELAGNRYAVVC